MAQPELRIAWMALSLVLFVSRYSAAQEAVGRSQQTSGSNADSQEKQRRQILESERWRRAQRNFNEWLSVQQIYTPEQIESVKSELAERIANMTPRELEDFLKDMEERLAVLTSPDAEDARHWLAQFFAVARNPEAQLGRSRPDVLNMTASQIRQELLWLQQHREARQQTQAAFDRSRALQNQSGRGMQDARRQARTGGADSRSRAAANQFRSPYSPRGTRPADRPNTSELRPQPRRPIYSLSPWGTPIYWHPMAGQW